jgi:hypothetical protein
VHNLERGGFVRDGELTEIGRIVRDAFEPVCRVVETRWRDRHGSALLDDVIGAVHVEGRWRPFPLIVGTGTDFAVLGNVA